MNFVFTPEAEEQAEECDAWWRRHRKATASLFAQELAAVKELILKSPGIGTVSRHSTASPCAASS
jgi:hypothetical protein